MAKSALKFKDSVAQYERIAAEVAASWSESASMK